MTSTAITSTGTRQTQNLAAPPTQNTAPVLEYRCLYTHDLRRKQKRWQDGSMRFHTFNKRVMVYEAPSRSYIGDQHWREDGVPQDGDELQLDRPVLVQVGEAIGSTETDLTELLEKRKKPGELSSGIMKDSPRRDHTNAAPPMVPIRSTMVPSTQLRPKTLNALLGTPRGATGRASVPLKSPHELRNENDSAESTSERVTKRPRIEEPCEKAPMTASHTVGQRPVNVEAPPLGNNNQGRVTAQASRGPNSEQSPTLHLKTRSKPDELSKQYPRTKMQPCKKVTKQPENGPSPKKPRKNATIHETLDSDGMQMTSGKPKSSRDAEIVPAPYRRAGAAIASNGNVESSPTRESHMKSAAEPIQIFSDEEIVPASEPSKQRMKLQVASRKPRKKLMYRDLLPQDRPSARRSLSNEMAASEKTREKRTSRKPSTEMALSDLHDKEQGRLADRLDRYNGNIANSRDDAIQDTLDKEPKSSSLLMSDDDSDTLPISHYRIKKKVSRSRGPTTSGRQQKPPQPRTDQENSIPKAFSTVHDTTLTLAKMDEIMFSSSQQQPPRSPSPILIDESDPKHKRSLHAKPKPPLNKLTKSATPTKAAPTILVSSSPGFQTPFHALPSKSPPAKVTLPGVPRTKTPSPKPPPRGKSSSHLTPPSKKPSPKHAFLNQTTTNEPLAKTPANSQFAQNPHTKSPPPHILSPNPSIAKPPPPTPQPPNSPSRTSPTSPSPPPSPSPAPSPSTTQLPPPPPPALFPQFPHAPNAEETFNLRIAQKPLPAFQAPRQRPRSPLKKSTSDTTNTTSTSTIQTTSMCPPSGMEEAEVKAKGDADVGMGTRDEEGGVPWSKEAWDLFGCGRDGVECTYEEFKVKEGLI